MADTVRYYHGGVPGLKPGDKVQPPSATGKSTLYQYAKDNPRSTQRDDRVYVTSSVDAAKMFAFPYPFGTVYEVEPGGSLEHDPDCDLEGLSFQCEDATVVRIIAERVGSDARERDAILGALLA